MSLRLIFYGLFFTVFFHTFSIDMKYFVFPLTVGGVYQIGKMDTHNTIVKSYLNSPEDSNNKGSFMFIGYTSKQYVGQESDPSIRSESYIGFAPLPFLLGTVLTGVCFGKNSLNPIFVGSALTIAYAYYMPFKINPFIWKNKNGIKENKVICSGLKKIGLNDGI